LLQDEDCCGMKMWLDIELRDIKHASFFVTILNLYKKYVF
jgi:hypothetical protein